MAGVQRRHKNQPSAEERTKRAHNSNQLAAVWWNYKLRAGNRIVLSLSPTRLHPSIRQSAKSDESTHSLFPVKMFPSFWQASAFYAVPLKKNAIKRQRWDDDLPPLSRDKSPQHKGEKRERKKICTSRCRRNLQWEREKAGKICCQMYIALPLSGVAQLGNSFRFRACTERELEFMIYLGCKKRAEKATPGGLFAAQLYTGKSSRSSLSGFDIYESIWDDCRENLSAYINWAMEFGFNLIRLWGIAVNSNAFQMGRSLASHNSRNNSSKKIIL